VRPIIISLAFVLLAGRAGAGAGDVPDAWLGLWRLDVTRSTYAAEPPYRRATYRIERTADGFSVVYDMVHPRGGTTHLEWVGRMDGRDYRLQGVDEAMTYAYTPADPGAADVVVKIDGRVAARSHISVSADGRTMTTRTTVRGAGGAPVVTTTVYEKQPPR
jgi:hypothetical protein